MQLNMLQTFDRDILINNLLTPWFPYWHFTALLQFIFAFEKSHFKIWIGSLGIKDRLGDGFMKELLSTVFSTNLRFILCSQPRLWNQEWSRGKWLSRLFQSAHPFPSLHPHITVLFTLLLETCRGQKCYFTPETRAPLSIQVYVSNNVQECI